MPDHLLPRGPGPVIIRSASTNKLGLPGQSASSASDLIAELKAANGMASLKKTKKTDQSGSKIFFGTDEKSAASERWSKAVSVESNPDNTQREKQQSSVGIINIYLFIYLFICLVFWCTSVYKMYTQMMI